MNEEEQYKKELADAGVTIPEAEGEKDKPEPPKEAPTDNKKPDDSPKEPEADKKEEPAPLPVPEPQRKRSIYDDFKANKRELKSEKERAEALERDNAELQKKLEALGKAETPEEKKDATDALDAFAAKINADPAAMREMRDLFLKSIPSQIDESLKKSLEEFQAWKLANSQTIEKTMFEEEYTRSTPKLKEIFPTASPEEMLAIKAQLDTLSHSKEWHDKSLAYIAFEHKDTLSALITPKKRGMESDRRKADETISTEFDPEADYTKMSAKDREIWETQYKDMMRAEGLSTGANGRKIII